MDPKEYLKISQKLIVMQDAGPAHYRSAIGRAYYAAYNVTAGLFEGLGYPLSKSSSGHENAVQLLRSSEDDALKEIGRLLGDLRTDRNYADYDMGKLSAEKNSVAKAKVETATDIVRTTIDDFLEDEARKKKVISEIKKNYTRVTGKSGLLHE